MKRHDRIGLVVGGVLLTSAMVGEGCSFNPFVIEPRETATGGNGGEGSGAGGAGGKMGASSSSSSSTSSGMDCDCLPDGEECTTDQCNSENTCLHTPLPRGTLCTGGICDENGNCQTCLDCTTPECTLRCRGTACENDTTAQCVAGNVCDKEDNLCCNDNCDGPCKVCDFSGLGGTCVKLPPGMQADQCNGSNACDGSGACIPLDDSLGDWSPLGALCGFGLPLCKSGSCRARSCRTNNGGLCMDHLECVSNLCDLSTHTCKACDRNSDCPEGSACNMNSHQCKSWLGAPCSQELDCAAGTCAGVHDLCSLRLDSACTDHTQCASRNCSKGGKCVTCTNDGECAAGTQCIYSASIGYQICLLAPGNLCAHDYNCDSGICTGFPPRCQ